LSDLGIDQKDTPAFKALMVELEERDALVNKAREEYDAALEEMWASERAEADTATSEQLELELVPSVPLTEDQIIEANQDEYVAQVDSILDETLDSLEANEEVTDASLLERIAKLLEASELLPDAQVLPAQKKALETMRRVLTHTKKGTERKKPLTGS
jgi:hypothetical protein